MQKNENTQLNTVPETIVTYCLIGLGQRALGYVKYIHKRSLPFRLLGVYDQNTKYQTTFLSKIKRYTLDHPPKGYTSIGDMKKDRDRIQSVFICTPDNTHLSVLSSVVDWNIHIVLEKPITTTHEDSIKMLDVVSNYSSFIHVPLVLRFTNHYREVKRLLSNETMGKLVQVQMTLGLTVSHTASYQRRWHRLRSKSGGFIVTKCCHDVDLLHWLIDSQPKHISSFSRNSTFAHPKKADGCAECPEHVKDPCVYDFDGRYVVKTDMEDIGVYDRCVYDVENESIDGQCAILLYENGVLCSYNIQMFQPESSRSMEIICEHGRIRSCFNTNRIEVTYTDDRETGIYYPKYDAIGHSGGDVQFLEYIHTKMIGKSSHTLLEESVRAMDTCTGILQSSDTNTVVTR
jgi:predicted dehydrogenase